MKLKLVTGPAADPVTVAECRAHMHLDASDDDTYLGTLVDAAITACELFTRRAFITQTLEVALDDAPRENYIELLRAPLATVTSVTWYDDADTATVISASDYYVDTYAEPGRLVLRDGEVWPDQGDLRVANGIIVRYTAGYGAAGTAVPVQILTAIKETVKTWYDGGAQDTSIEERRFQTMPSCAQALLKPYRLVML